MMGDDVISDADQSTLDVDQTNQPFIHKSGEDNKTGFHLCGDVNGNKNTASLPDSTEVISTGKELSPVDESRSKVIETGEGLEFEEIESVTVLEDDINAGGAEETSKDSILELDVDVTSYNIEESSKEITNLVDDDGTTKQTDTECDVSDIATRKSVDDKQHISELHVNCESDGVNKNYNNNCTELTNSLSNAHTSVACISEKVNLNQSANCSSVACSKQDKEEGNISQNTSRLSQEDIEVAGILGDTPADEQVGVAITEADVLDLLDEIIETEEKLSSSESNAESVSLKSSTNVAKDQEADAHSRHQTSQSDTEEDILNTLTEIDKIIESAEKAYSSSESDSEEISHSKPSAIDIQSNLDRKSKSLSLSDSEIEMGRRSLSFKRKSQHMVYTEDEFREQYTSIDKGKSLDSSAKQDIKRGFQRLKAERAGNRHLRHTRSLSTPAAGESYSGNGGPSPRNKAGRPISMVDSGTDTSEFFKDNNTKANMQLRGLMSPNETNNNKNIENASLQIDVKADMEIRPQKAENVNAGNPISPRSRKSPNSPANPDLSITSGYDMGGTAPSSQTKPISLKNNLQNGDMNGTPAKNRNADIRKTEIAIERQMAVKQAIKGSPEDKLSPRATLPSPSEDKLSLTATLPSSSRLNGSGDMSPPVSIQNAGPFTVTTRIVDGEEELTIGNVPLEETHPQSAPVTTSSRPRHFACIEPVGQPVVGHPPRISQIEPVLVRPAPQQNQSVNAVSSSDSPDTLSAMMSVTVTAATMPELQKPQVTTVTSSQTNGNVIVPQTELVVETKRELGTETTDGPYGSLTETKSTSPVVSNSPSPIPESAVQLRSHQAKMSPRTTTPATKNRFVFPSIARDESIEVTTDDDDDDEHGIYDDSFRNSGWIYIGGNQELQMITGPISLQQQQKLKQQQQSGANAKVVKAQVESKPYKKNKKKVAEKKRDDEARDDDEVFSREDPSRESSGTTASEEEFKKQYQSVALRRIQRKQSIMDYQRLSQIAREREVIVEKENNLFGFRIQYSKPVVVTDIDQGGAAEKAGLKVGDMVLKVNGQNVTQSTHSQVVKIAAAAPDKLVLLVGTNVCNTLNLEAVKPVMTGHLWKLGGSSVFSNWKRRWFVLKHDNVLYYYKTKEDAEPLGAIVLCNYTVVKARDVGKPNAFRLTKHKARTFHMYSQTAEEMNSWAKAITESSRPNSTTDIWLDISTHNVSIPALSIKYPDCHGVLTKMGGRRKTWKRRYCVLKDACLYYYKDIDAPQALGVAHFHGYSIQETEIGSKKYAFILKAPEEKLRTFYFIADHETDRKRWVAAFAYSIGRWIQTNTGDDSDEEGNEMLI